MKQKQQRQDQQNRHTDSDGVVRQVPLGGGGEGVSAEGEPLPYRLAERSAGELVPSHHSCRQRDARTGDDRQRDTIPKPHERHRLRPLTAGGDGSETRDWRTFDSHRPRLDGYEDSPETDEQILYRYGAHRP